MKPLSWLILAVVIVVPMALGITYAAGTSADARQARPEMMEATTRAAESTALAAKQVMAAHRIARAKCEILVGVDRGNCRSEARAEARRALRGVQGAGPHA